MQETTSQVCAHLLQVSGLDLVGLLHQELLGLYDLLRVLLGLRGAGVVRGFQREGGQDSQLFEHDDPARRLFIFLVRELALAEGEGRGVRLSHQVRDYLDQVVIPELVLLLGIATAVHEHVAFA